MANLGGTPYYNINTTYTDANGTPISNSVTYTRFWANNTNAPSGTQSVSDSAIQNMILSGFNGGQITYDPNTVYTVFSSGRGEPRRRVRAVRISSTAPITGTSLRRGAPWSMP